MAQSILRAALFALALCGAAAFADTSADPVLGVWRTQSGNGLIEIAPCDDSVCGRVIGGRGEPLDRNNADHALRQRRLVGLTILSGYERGARGWDNGRIYNPEDGRTYRSRLAPGEDGALRVTGCFGPICRTQIWTRAPAA
jgi:uncharacterized protein (DUF2147 family)